MESIVLALFAFVLAVAIFFARRWYNGRHLSPLTSRVEALFRVLLMLLGAWVVHLIYGPDDEGALRFWLTTLSSTFLIYGATHFADRVVERASKLTH